ncbi:SAVED domain-containing protein [Pseudomonas sp. MH9.2]|uniref:Hachiman antiphage defense system protein HamA n=1 Tax=Pseudomonas sp. MH9.2 TaxID=3048629 RepID=UPI002AC9A291|nr:Hachiman antiphage defense system protein HamA [Pseudomonas sp. MH9.2]MEB0024751.1 SAVED domain-containing protein [Pseudomonas sp. MH9.2]WPX70693.1 SAVED domain-containing protein [Pseudomonas sp. MH9.2]
MSSIADHLGWLEDSGTVIKSMCGRDIPVLKLKYDTSDTAMMSSWAKHFRNHYCRDEELPFIKNPTKTNQQYLLTEKFPHQLNAPGPSIRAGDFAEILIADYLEYIRNYQVPRTRYDRKGIANESTKGSDVLAFKKTKGVISDQDELLIFEVKAKASEKSKSNVLQNAINDSMKDEIRLAESLSAMRQKLFDRKDMDGVGLVDRFQREPDHPCKRRYGAGAVFTESSYDEELIAESDTSLHPNQHHLEMIVVSGELLMSLVHELYRRAANEA